MSSSDTPNIDVDLYIDDFINMLRDVLRAIAADDNTGALSNASRRMRRLIAQVEQLPPELNWYKIFDLSVAKLKPPYEPFDAPTAYERDYDHLAKLGVKLAAELTSSDNLAPARISKARQAIADGIKSVDNRRKLRRETRHMEF